MRVRVSETVRRDLAALMRVAGLIFFSAISRSFSSSRSSLRPRSSNVGTVGLLRSSRLPNFTSSLRIFRYYRQASVGSQGDHVALPVRWRYKLDRWRKEMAAKLHSEPKVARPKLCPACGTLLGASATQCHQCGASATFGIAAATRSLARYVPQTAPVTYGILALCCILYGVSFLATVNRNGLGSQGGGGLGAILNLGGISGPILARMGMSGPFDLVQPWRLVTAIFLHGGLLHIGFNMWVLMDVGPMVEEMYGSARYLFLYVAT